MSGSRLGRGRGGRLAVYGGCLVVVVLLVFLYRAATTEMTRLRELHIQCSHQQEALAAQLQVIFEYKVRLEKSLAEEKSSNTAIKQELQQRASREKSLRDKDSVEALQKFNSLQQHHKLLQSEHQDLKEEYAKRQKLALEESNRLESTLQDLRGQIREKDKACDESMQHLKNKYLELETEKKKLDDKYNDLIKSTGNSDSRVERLNKEVFQLKRELTKTKASCKTIPSDLTLTNPQSSQQIGQPSSADQQVAPSRQQNSQPTSLSNLVTGSPTKSSVNSVSTASDKSNVGIPAKSVTRMKLPIGVVPIPRMIDQTNERNEDPHPKESRRPDGDKNFQPNNNHSELKNPEGPKALNNEIPEGLGDNARHIGAQILNRGFQEIGDEPNHFVRMPGFDDGRGVQGGDDQYEDYRDPQQKNDINLEENEEEEEDEDEDDQIEYHNNGKPQKHE